MQGCSNRSAWSRVRGWVGFSAGLTASVLLGTAGMAIGAEPPRGADDSGVDHAEHGLPFFDARQTPGETATPAVERVLQRLRTGEVWKKREARLNTLKAQIPELRSDDHHLFGTPQFLRSTAAMLTGPSRDDSRTVVSNYLAENIDLFEISSKDLESARIVRDADTHGIMRHLTFQQTLDGLDLYGNILRTSVTARGELINVSSLMIPSPAGGWEIPARQLSAREALFKAAADAGIEIVTEPAAGEAAGAEAKTTWAVGPEFDHWLPVTTRQVYFAMTREDVRPAYVVVVPTKGVGHTYETVIDAVNGDVLRRQNYLAFDTTQPATYRVYDGDSPAPGSPGTPTPSGVQFPFVPRDLVTVTPAMIIAQSPNGWIPDGGTSSVGNNVDAYLDTANDNSGSAADRVTSATRVFDFPMATDGSNFPTGEPATYAQASVTQGFYWANEYHDRLRALGFDEAAGNFQTDNFGLGGAGNDPVNMEMQDGSGTNNANFATPADGGRGRCQMYRFTPTTPDRDGGFDSEIVFHELTHGTSTRCHELTLSGTQARSMGEGWGDFFGIALNHDTADDLNAVYTTGGHTTYLFFGAGYTTNYYFGIRRFPYSTDESKNPQTYADIDVAQQSYPVEVPRNTGVGNTANEVHNAGEVWCNALIECRAAIGADEGAAANQTTMQVVTDGMKLAPANPNFLQERDAIIQSDLVRYGGSHAARLWEAFADSGMGFSATSPVGGTTTGIVEAFDTPQRVVFGYPDGLPTQLDPGVPASFHVTMTPQSLTITPNSAQLFVSVNGGSFAASSMTPTGPDTYLATIPGAACLADVSFYVQVGTSIGNRTDPFNAPVAAFDATVFTSDVIYATDTMEIDAGWTVGPNTATTGNWNRMNPQATTAQPEDDHTAAPGVNCWVTDGNAGTGAGSFDVDGGSTLLTSPPLNLTGHPDAKIGYWRWYSNSAGGDPNNDVFTVQISNDGATWQTLEIVGPAGPETSGGWIYHEARVGDFVAPNSSVRLRFTAADLGTGSLIEAAVDDLIAYERICVPPPACDPDVNCDGAVNGFDVQATEEAVNGDFSNFCQASADLNGDGTENGFDIETEEQRVNGAPC
ncbi:hypothetical protein PHYC_03796 [Phycisphaerales bacterium]|nr:hypothetical protein PHYC_03796 [Phycisphaerales bacterium]